MNDYAKAYLEELGYSVNGNALAIIKMCNDWYSNREIKDFHVRKNLNNVELKLNRMNFAKRCCADDANLCEIISVAPEKESTSKEFIEQILRNNRFDVRYREQLEKTSATGTVGAYLYLDSATYVQDQEKHFPYLGMIPRKYKLKYVRRLLIIINFARMRV